MKKIKLLFLLCCFVAKAKAQEQMDCDFNLKQAIFYLNGDENFKRDTLKSIKCLEPCIKKGEAKAKILLSRIYASQNNEKNNKKAFKILKELVKEENAIAAGDLGVLYKYGIGCRLNFNKARKWFKKGAQLGNDKAAYSLGYLFLKGFGNIDQDYNKAVKWFSKSEYPMAKYWLGVCYYYGYGVSQNIDKANELLGTNFEKNSSLNQSNTNSENSSDESPNLLDSQIDGSSSSIDLSEIIEEDLYGKWSGKLLKFDWSGKNIEQKHDFSLEIKYDSVKEQGVFSLNVNDQELENRTINILDNEIYFDELHINLPHNSFNEKIPSNLNHQFLSTDIKIRNIDGFSFLTGNIKSYINSWNESAAPLKFVLKKKETFANSEEELSDEILMALSEQEDNFIKLYPNPFETDLIISYTLDNTSFVEVKITDINATKNNVIEKGKEQKAGKYRYYFNGSNLQKGIYVVSVYVNNEKKTRVIVKK